MTFILNNTLNLLMNFLSISSKKSQTTKKIDISVNRKQIELLIFKDDNSIETIKKVIDYVSISQHKEVITRPILLRKNFKALLKELNELSNKSN